MRRRFFSALAVSVGLCASAAEVSVVETRGDVNAAVGCVAASGGGRVVVPAGDWEAPGLVLKSNVELHLEKGARLLFATNLSGLVRIDVPRCEGCTHALVSAVGVTNVAITGEGELVGRGEAWPQPVPRQSHLIRPKGVVFANCRDIRLSDFLLRDSPSWGIVFKCCDGVVTRRVRVDSHANANNDGFDIEARNVLIEYCDVDSGDDAYCLKSNDPDFVMENVTIRHCVGRSTCNAFKIGTASHGIVRNVCFEDCRTEAPKRSFVSRVRSPKMPPFGDEWFHDNRVRNWAGGPERLAGMAGIAIECVDGGEVSDIICRRFDIRGMMTPIFVRGGTRSRRSCGTPPSSRRILRDILIADVRAEAESFVASSITGVNCCRPSNVRLENVVLVCKPGKSSVAVCPVPECEGSYPEANMFGMLPTRGLYVRHADNVVLKNVSLICDDKNAGRLLYHEDATVLSLANVEGALPNGREMAPLDVKWGRRLEGQNWVED